MITIDFTKEELEIIERALSLLHSQQVMQATRSRSYSKKHINYKDAQKREERIKQKRDEWSKYSDETLTVIHKIDSVTNETVHQTRGRFFKG